jgi:hypothetical protein
MPMYRVTYPDKVYREVPQGKDQYGRQRNNLGVTFSDFKWFALEAEDDEDALRKAEAQMRVLNVQGFELAEYRHIATKECEQYYERISS